MYSTVFYIHSNQHTIKLSQAVIKEVFPLTIDFNFTHFTSVKLQPIK